MVTLTPRRVLLVFVATHALLIGVALAGLDLDVVATVIICAVTVLIPGSIWSSVRVGGARRDAPILIFAVVSAALYVGGVVYASLPGTEDSADIGGGVPILVGLIGLVVSALAAPRD